MMMGIILEPPVEGDTNMRKLPVEEVEEVEVIVGDTRIEKPVEK